MSGDSSASGSLLAVAGFSASCALGSSFAAGFSSTAFGSSFAGSAAGSSTLADSSFLGAFFTTGFAFGGVNEVGFMMKFMIFSASSMETLLLAAFTSIPISVALSTTSLLLIPNSVAISDTFTLSDISS